MFDLFPSSKGTDFRATDAAGRRGYLAFSPEGIEFHPDFTGAARREFPCGAIVDVAIDASIEESERFTFTRLFFFKLYALAFPKRTQREHVSIHILLSDGSETGFLLEQTSATDAYRKVESFIELYRSKAVVVPAQNVSITSELERLHGMYVSGALTQEEFARAKQQLLQGDTPR